jgi:hypothetical protein
MAAEAWLDLFPRTRTDFSFQNPVRKEKIGAILLYTYYPRPKIKMGMRRNDDRDRPPVA